MYRRERPRQKQQKAAALQGGPSHWQWQCCCALGAFKPSLLVLIQGEQDMSRSTILPLHTAAAASRHSVSSPALQCQVEQRQHTPLVNDRKTASQFHSETPPYGCVCLQGNKFHRIVSGFCCQGGDVVRGMCLMQTNCPYARSLHWLSCYAHTQHTGVACAAHACAHAGNCSIGTNPG